MAKILLVEDDNNLREIFEMRLKAEGYTIVTAHDGEQALVVAMQEKPDLIITDVMMPKLSGFEMIETLKASPEMKNVKVIMMTALGQAEDRSQGDKLGVDKYLVKSQVTLEDFVRVTHEVLEGVGGVSMQPTADPADPALKALADSVNPATSTPVPTATPEPAPPAVEAAADPITQTVPPAPVVEPPVSPSPNPVVTSTPAADPPTPVSDSPQPTPITTDPRTPPAPPETVFTSLDNLPTSPNMAAPAAAESDQPTKADEIASVEAEINSFVDNQTTPDTPASTVTTAPSPVPTDMPEVVQAPPLAPNELPEVKPKEEPDVVSTAPAQVVGVSMSHEKILQPLNSQTVKPDLNDLVAKDEVKAQAMKASEVQPTGTVLSVPPLPADVDIPDTPSPVTVIQPKPPENVILPQTTGNTTAPPPTTIDPNSVAL